ncbi:MAG: hypothetical protein GY953_30465, partial [bacterium]|nr:hypothetical protein [bacterium]
AAFSDDWRERYPAMIASWENSWAEFVPFLEFPAELRKIVYTTNSIESLNARFRRAVRHRGHFPTEQAGWIQPVDATPGGSCASESSRSSASAGVLHCRRLRGRLFNCAATKSRYPRW